MLTIIVPLDGSALAEQALPYGQLLSRLLGAPVRLVAVVAQSEVDGLVAGKAALQSTLSGAEAVGFERTRVAREVLAERARAYLARHLEALRAAGVQADDDVVIGEPADELCAVARATGDALLVMVPHSYDGNTASPSTGVTDAVIEAHVAPVFVVRSATVTLTSGLAPLALRKILLPIDTPERSQAELTWAVRLARAAGAEILVLHADLMAVHDPSIGVAAREKLTEALQTLTTHTARDHGVTVTPVVIGGVTDTTILEAAGHNGADLIIFGIEPQGWLRRRLLGSVSDSVRRAAPMPVLIVPRDGSQG